MSNVYKLQEGDTPITVARTYGVSIARLIKVNGLSMNVGGEMLALMFNYIGRADCKLKAGKIMSCTFRSDAAGRPVYADKSNPDDVRFYVFPNGIPESQPIEVGSPFQDGPKIFVTETDWFTVTPWLIGQEIIIPDKEEGTTHV
jgi:hypothetical protein